MTESPSPRLLVVGDDEGRAVIGRTLRAGSIDATEATTGHHALQLASDNPSVIVIEGPLAALPAFELIGKLRANTQTAVIPILYMSASFAREDGRLFGSNDGADAYLAHPIEPSVIVATVRSLMRMRRLEETQRAGSA